MKNYRFEFVLNALLSAHTSGTYTGMSREWSRFRFFFIHFSNTKNVAVKVNFQIFYTDQIFIRIDHSVSIIDAISKKAFPYSNADRIALKFFF